MQLTLSLEEFNAFLLVYIKAVMYEEVDYKKGLLEKIKSSGNSEAAMLWKQRQDNIHDGKWDVTNEKKFNDQIHEMMPDLKMKNVTEFDEFISMMNARNMDTFLRLKYFKQEPKMRLYLKRFIDQIEGDDHIQVRLIV